LAVAVKAVSSSSIRFLISPSGPWLETEAVLFIEWFASRSEVVRRSDFLALSPREASRLSDAFGCVFTRFAFHTIRKRPGSRLVHATPQDLGTPLKLCMVHAKHFGAKWHPHMWLELYHVFKLYIQRILLFSPHLLNPINQLNMKLNMKLNISYLTIASAISIAAATSCTHENAPPWPYTEEESCDTVACAQEQAYANCIAVSAVSGRICVRTPSMLKRKVDIDCTSTETCTVSPADNSLVCLETFSGRWAMLLILSSLPNRG
jgi:hypothetical protein